MERDGTWQVEGVRQGQGVSRHAGDRALREDAREMEGRRPTADAAPDDEPAAKAAGSAGAPDRTLWVLLLAALALRVLWWSIYPLVISNEGAEYARIAQNLFAGRGYVGMLGGPHVFFPPLYPALIGVLAWFGGSEEFAGRLISLISGVALVGVVYLLARRVFNRRVGTLAGVLAACHPLLIATSVSVYSESLFAVLVFAGVYFAIDALGKPSIKPAALAGTLFGLAYLTRPEGIAFAMLFAALLACRAIWCRRGFWRGAGQAAALLLAAGLIAAPYVVHLSELAGEFRWEGKSAGNNVINARMAFGMSHAEAALGLREMNGRRGPWLDLADARVLLRQRDAHVGGLAATLFSAPGDRVMQVGRALIHESSLGAPIILLLVLLGIANASAWRGHVWEAAGLLAMLGVQLLILMSVQFLYGRFFWGMVPLLVIWTAVGLDGLTDWVVRWMFAEQPTRRRGAIAFNLVVIAAITSISLRGVWKAGDINMERDRVAAEAGNWIRQDFARTHPDGRQPMLMGFGGVVAYYARGIARFLPYADEQEALLYIHKSAPDYIVLRGRETGDGPPYVSAWLNGKPGDPCAELARDSWSSAKAPLRIWRWNC